MKIAIIALIISTVMIEILAYQVFKYKPTATILSAWIVKKGYAPPTDEEVRSLSKWAMQSLFKTRAN